MDRRPARRRRRLPGGRARHGRVGLRPGQARRPVHRDDPEPRGRLRRGAAADRPRRPERRGVPAAHHARAARRVARRRIEPLERRAGSGRRFVSASSGRSTRPSGGATYPASSLRCCAKPPSMRPIKFLVENGSSMTDLLGPLLGSERAGESEHVVRCGRRFRVRRPGRLESGRRAQPVTATGDDLGVEG